MIVKLLNNALCEGLEYQRTENLKIMFLEVFSVADKSGPTMNSFIKNKESINTFFIFYD